MTKKSRYFLLLFGFITFIVLAPVMVLYVRGLSYNFKDGQFVQAGLMAYVADPKGSQIFLNGELKRGSSGDINFLPAGEYQVTVKYPGRLDWNKRLSVFASQVTWANPKDSKIYLFLEPQVAKTLGGKIDDFYSHDNDLIFLQNHSVVISKLNNPSLSRNYPLPKAADKIIYVDGQGENFIFGNSTDPTIKIFFNFSNGKIIDLSDLLKTPNQFQFTGNTLYVLNAGNVYKVNPETKILDLLVKNVSAFFFLDDDIYLLQKTLSQTQLILLQRPYNNRQILIKDLPDFSNPRLLVSFSKQIFILSQNKFYLASSGMKELAQNVNDFNFDEQNQAISISQSGELDYYDTYNQNFSFVTRSMHELKNPVILSAISHAFYSTKSQIFATELDNRNNQNSYNLYTGQNIKKILVDEAGKNIVFLDGDELKSLKVR